MIKTWTTQIQAIDYRDGLLKQWVGDNVEAPTEYLAQEILNTTGRGYMRVVGELICEIPCNEETLEPNYKKAKHYDTIQQN